MQHEPILTTKSTKMIANPVVRLIVRSPSHSLLSKALLLVGLRGRWSGIEHTLPVQYA